MDGIIEPPEQNNKLYRMEHQQQTTPQANAMHQAMHMQKQYAAKAFKIIGLFIVLGMLFSFGISFFAFQTVNQQVNDAFEKSIEVNGIMEHKLPEEYFSN